jgi:2',3'-cyclic-nucleotide 2'-phosphodiesterase (5'-nucleotidase family)
MLLVPSPAPPSPTAAVGLRGAVLLGILLGAGCVPKPVALPSASAPMHEAPPPAAYGAPPAATSKSPSPILGLSGELAIDGPIGKRLSTVPADVVVFYGGEQKGSTETCGCPHRPRGSLARLDAYVNASRAANAAVPSVLVNGGYWLEDAMGFDGTLRADVAVENAWMIKAVRLGGWDALNVGYNDLAGLATLPADEGPPLPLVSANAEGPGIQRWVVVQRGGVRIGITGITGQGQTLTDVPGYTVGPPARAGKVIDELAAQSDVVVLLAYQATEAAKALAESHPDIDVVVESARHSEFAEPFYVGRAVWVLAHYQTMRAGELRLHMTDGRVAGAIDRKIDLDPDMPDDPALLALSRKARIELDAAQEKLYGGP